MSLDSIQRFWTVISAMLGSVALVSKLLWDVKGKWDETNHVLLGLVKTVADMYAVNAQDHARMDRRADKLEDRIIEHIGRHRRLLGSLWDKSLAKVSKYGTETNPDTTQTARREKPPKYTPATKSGHKLFHPISR